MKVVVLMVNDAILGVYSSKELAEEERDRWDKANTIQGARVFHTHEVKVDTFPHMQ
jgi:hypothetical protein